MAKVSTIVRSIHERVDGQGYPDGLSGEEIPLASRIIGLCAAFVRMTNALPNRPARTIDQAFEELRRHGGTEFDSAVVEALVDAYGDHDARLAVA